MFKVVVQEPRFDAGSETEQLLSLSRAVGGIATFLGAVRDINEGDDVSGLHLEHYPGMTEKLIHGIIEEAADRWQLIGATVIHRVGDLVPGDAIVFVGTASEHRKDAFEACEFIMDYLKTRATFWKKEQTSDGARWLTTRASDHDAANRWKA